jgi:hypothetical protein
MYNVILIYGFTIIETGGFGRNHPMHRGYWNIMLFLFMTLKLLRPVDLMCFCSKRADDVEKDCKN